VRLRCRFTTRASPEQVVRAYTEFGDRRLEIWRDTLTRENYALLEQGDGWAVVREGALRMGVVLRYTWAEPGSVRWEVLHSSFCRSGAGRLQVHRLAGGGARVEVAIDEHGGKGFRGVVVLALKGLLGPLVLPRTSRRALDRLADEDRRPA
jgi:hypothetical protein